MRVRRHAATDAAHAGPHACASYAFADARANASADARANASADTRANAAATGGAGAPAHAVLRVVANTAATGAGATSGGWPIAADGGTATATHSDSVLFAATGTHTGASEPLRRVRQPQQRDACADE